MDNNFTYVTNNEIAVHDFSSACRLAEELLNNGYVVMISREEQLFIVNYLWSPNNAGRNTVCFQNKDIVEDFAFNNGDYE